MTDNLWIVALLIGGYLLGYLHGYLNKVKFQILESVRLDALLEWVNENVKVFAEMGSEKIQVAMTRGLIDANIKAKAKQTDHNPDATEMVEEQNDD